MLNKYFRIDGNNSLDFMYANIAVQNIYFALISLGYIFDSGKYDIGVYHDKHTYYFFHIQSILTACGNISNVFYNPGGYNGRQHTERCQRLRTTFNINKNNYPLVFQKEVRNTNEHFDERYEEFGGNLGDYNLLNHDTDPYMRAVIQTNPHLRTLDVENFLYYTYIRKSGRFERFAYDLNVLRRQLEQLRDAIIENPVFSSAWVEEMSTERIE